MFGKNGNGRWTQAYWSGWVRVNSPRKPGWYAARPGCCNMTVRVLVDTNLLDCKVDGSNVRYDTNDFDWWYPLKNAFDELPEFRE